MSQDRREDILARLVAVAATLVTEDCAFRNTISVPEKKRPAIVILDGDEIADEADNERKRPPLAPRIVAMTPEVHFLLEGRADTAAEGDQVRVGGALNTLRTRFLKAVLTDASLVALCVDGDIRYDGFTTGLGAGRSMEGEAGVGLTFRYLLRPDKL